MNPPSSSKIKRGWVTPRLKKLAVWVRPDGSVDAQPNLESSEQSDEAEKRIARLRALAAMVKTEDARQHLIEMIDLLEDELDAREPPK
jgi:ribosome-associated translation inhibitor RaiA